MTDITYPGSAADLVLSVGDVGVASADATGSYMPFYGSGSTLQFSTTADALTFSIEDAADRTRITYDGDLRDLKVKIGAPAEIRERLGRAFMHGFHWDGNVSRLTFDPDTTTDMQLELRPAGRWPRLRRRPSVPRG